MTSLTRREALKLAPLGAAAALQPLHLNAQKAHAPVAVWDIFEAAFRATYSGNPYTDHSLRATFTQNHRSVEVDGFCDGVSDGQANFKVRFMPDHPGTWDYTIHSDLTSLDGLQGSFAATPAEAGAHGLVSVRNAHHFAYADGTPYFPFGTTCYAWTHQTEELQQQTLKTLAASPFNKVRMCVFPKSYEYNHNDPEFFPFERSSAGVNDYTRPNPAFFAHLEKRLADLRALNIEADLILFHPYDSWGFASMPAEADELYLRYLIARVGCYRNVWWSLANEFDLMKAKSAQDFDRLFHVVEEKDPYNHLRSIHYSVTMYDYKKPWVTHASLQTADFAAAPGYLASWNKPVVYDEVMYEGNLNRRWGNLSGDEMTHRFWLGVINGCYVTHGETYLDPEYSLDENATHTIFWSQGGPLRGTSPKQIAFLRKLLEETVHLKPGEHHARTGLTAGEKPYYLNATAVAADGKTAQTILYYFDFHQPVWYEFPLPEGEFTFEWIDTLAMTITPKPGTHKGKTKLLLPGKPFQAVRFRTVTGK